MDFKLIIILIVLLSSISINILLFEKYTRAEDKFNTYYQLQYFSNYNSTGGGMNGVYYDGVMCVALKGRDWADVMETCNHEFLHYKFDDHFK